MIDPLRTATSIAGAGLQAQSVRLRVVAENIANARSTGATPGADPYTRKTVTFDSEFDRTLGAATVQVHAIGTDQTPFQVEYKPGQPGRRQGRQRQDAQRQRHPRNGRHARSKPVL